MRPVLYFGLVVLFFVFSSSAFAQLEKPYEPRLIAKPNPALADINSLMIVIIPSPSEPNTDSLVWSQLIKTVSEKLNKAGISIIAGVAGNILEIPELRVNIDLLKLSDSQQYVFRVQTSIARKVLLEDVSESYIKADVFQTDPVIQIVQINGMPEVVLDAVSYQVDIFISAWSVSQRLNHRTDVNQPQTQSTKAVVEKDSKPVKKRDAETQYVASKNSKVFHKADCSSAKRILPKNLITYATREDAIKTGKRPCKRCNP